jgi:hypothetical protein
MDLIPTDDEGKQLESMQERDLQGEIASQRYEAIK